MPEDDVIYHLELLRKDLEAEGLAARLVAPAGNRPPFVRAFGAVSVMVEQITVRDGHFQWSWGDPINAVRQHGDAARRIAHVLTPTPRTSPPSPVGPSPVQRIRRRDDN